MVVVWLLCGCCGVVVFRFFLFFMQAILSFCDFWTFFVVVFDFSFHLCFDLPQVPNCYESDSFIFCFLDHFLLFLIFLFIFALTFHKCQIVKKGILSFLFFAFF